MQILIPLVIIVFSAIIHEIMHGYVADKLGDPTARNMGRLTLNPIPHIDPIMTIVMPTMLFLFSGGLLIFGGAKPIPINLLNLKDRKKDTALVALAGPATHVVIFLFGSLLFKFLFPGISVVEVVISLNYFFQINILMATLATIIYFNVVYTVINLIPIPPLDGSRVIASFMPNDLVRQYMSIEPFGIFLLLILIFFPIGDFSLGILISKLISYTIHLLGV